MKHTADRRGRVPWSAIAAGLLLAACQVTVDLPLPKPGGLPPPTIVAEPQLGPAPKPVTEPPPVATLGPMQEELLRNANQARAARGADPLVAHGILQERAEELVVQWSAIASRGGEAPEADLDALRKEVPEGAVLWWQAWPAGDRERLVAATEAMEGLLEPSMTDVGIGLKQAAGTDSWLVYLLLAQRLPELTGEALEQGERLFHTTCALCGQSQYLEVTLGHGEEAGTLSAVCMSCGRTYDSFAQDTAGKYRRLHTYPEAFNPQAIASASKIWLRTLQRMEYEEDLPRYGRLDVWQRSAETWRDRRGDCEDGSLLLSDWLRANGHDTKVVVGLSDGEGHAWVVLHAEGRDYLLETTGGAASHLRTPPRAEMLPDYLPEAQFDGTTTWFRKDAAWTADYRDANGWVAGPG